MACENCSALNIPNHLCTEGKVTPGPIDLTELLYRRHKEDLRIDLLKLDLKIVERIFKVENDSYNRSSLSIPEDVLIDEFGNTFSNWGIFSVDISTFGTDMIFHIQNEDKVCTFKAVYDPKDCNYAHTEILSYVNGEIITGNKPPKSARTFFRRKILSYITEIKKYVA